MTKINQLANAKHPGFQFPLNQDTRRHHVQSNTSVTCFEQQQSPAESGNTCREPL